MIEVIGGDIWPFRIYVRSAPPRICTENYDDMQPESAVNLNPELDLYVCASCGGLIGGREKTEYNRVHGYSGFDEYNEFDGCEEAGNE